MKKSLPIALALLCVAGFLTEKNIRADSSETVVYDGKHRLVVMPDQIVEFNAANNSSVQNLDPGARIIKRTRFVTMWQVNNRTMTRSLRAGHVPIGLKGDFSPVLRDASGKKRALPGNVIVYMNKDWNNNKIYEWASSLNLTIVKCISTYNNIYVVKSSPGMPSLDLANSLRGKDGVRRVMPNWWTSVYRR